MDIDTTITLIRIAIHNRRQLVDKLRDHGAAHLQAITAAFAEDLEVLEHARDALVEARDLLEAAKGGRT